MVEKFSSPYDTLGLPSTASKDQVKEAFRRLCLVYHPDKCTVDLKPVAEAKFKSIKDAYDAILKGQAGYPPPPPGSKPFQGAYAHGMDHGGPTRVGGPYGGYATEANFYRAMARTSRNNPFILIITGLLCIPAISMFTSVMNGNTTFVQQFKNEGIHMFTEGRYRVNGHSTLTNPFSIRSIKNLEDSYIYKSDKYKHLRPQQEEGLNPA